MEDYFHRDSFVLFIWKLVLFIKCIVYIIFLTFEDFCENIKLNY